jgi:outer membrane autotransporter barrel domain
MLFLPKRNRNFLKISLLSATCLTGLGSPALAASCPAEVSNTITISGNMDESCVVAASENVYVAPGATGTLPSGTTNGKTIDFGSVAGGTFVNDGTLNAGTSSTNSGTSVVYVGTGGQVQSITNNGQLNLPRGRAIIFIDGGTVTGSVLNSASGRIVSEATGPGIELDNGGAIQGGIENSGLMQGANIGVIYAHGNSTISGGILNTQTGEIHGGDGRGVYVVDSALNGDLSSNALTNRGIIDGAEGGVVFEGGTVDGDVVNYGTITGIGDTAVKVEDGSTVTGSILNNGQISGTNGIVVENSVITGGITNNSTITATSGAAIRVDNATVGTIVNTGTLSGTKSLHITNPTGTVTVNNTGSLIGDVEMANTTLNINADNLNISGAVTGDVNSTINVAGNLTTRGNYTAGNLLIVSGKTLTTTHNFTVATFQNNGTFAINPTGTTSVSGNYDQSAAATLNLTVRSPTDYSKLVIDGTGAFSPGTHLFVDVKGSGFTSGSVLAGVIETNSRNATTFQVADNSYLYSFLAALNANGLNVDLVVLQDGSINDAVKAAGDPRNSGAAQALNTIFSSGSAPEVGAAFGALGSAQEIADAVAQTVPSTPSATSAAIINTMDNVGRIIQAREESNLGLSSGDDFIATRHVWLKPFVSRAEQDSKGGLAGFRGDTYGFVGGVDGVLSEKARLGVALAYANTDIDSKSSVAAQGVEVDSYQLAIYGSYSLDPRTDINFQGDIGYNDNSSRRVLNFGGLNSVAEADFSSWSLRASTGIGRTYSLGQSTTITPSTRVDYNWVRTGSYTETGAGALSLRMESQTTDQLVPAVEAKVTHSVTNDLSLMANAGVGYDVLSSDSIVTASYVGGGGAFTTTGLKPSPWIVRSGLGLAYQATDELDVTVRYDREDHGSSFDNQTLSAKMRVAF